MSLPNALRCAKSEPPLDYNQGLKHLYNSEARQVILKNWTFLLGLALCGPFGYSLILALQMAPLPESWASFAQFLFGASFPLLFVWFVFCILIPLMAIGAIANREFFPYAHKLPLYLVGWLILWSSPFVSRPTEDILRKQGMWRITQQAAPLVEAINAYHAKHGLYPEEMKELVPEYISQIPYTNAVGYPSFHYRTTDEDGLYESFQLSVHVSSGFMNNDLLIYWPEGSDDEELKGQRFERIGDWVYFAD